MGFFARERDPDLGVRLGLRKLGHALQVLDGAALLEQFYALEALKDVTLRSGGGGAGLETVVLGHGRKVGGSLERLHEPSGQQRITIAPVVSGAGGNGLGQILLGAALIAVSWWNPMGWAAAGSFLSQATLYSVGTSMILGGVAQMIAPTAKAQDPSERPENQPSYVFNGAVNTTAQGHPVPVGYGRLIVGSAVISAGIDVDEIAV